MDGKGDFEPGRRGVLFNLYASSVLTYMSLLISFI